MNAIYQNLSDGKMVYLIDLMDERVFQLIPNQDYCMTKYKGEDPYSVKRDTNMVLDAIHLGRVISEERFESF